MRSRTGWRRTGAAVQCSVNPQGRPAGGDLKTGYMEKRIGENSSRQNLPESWKWQKRYFVLSEPKGLLYYFKSADDPPTYRGIINVRECKIEDVDVNGLPKTASRSKYDLDGGGGTVSLLIKVSHKVSCGACCPRGSVSSPRRLQRGWRAGPQQARHQEAPLAGAALRECR